LTISYSNVKGGEAMMHVAHGSDYDWGSGMIDKDPLFVDPSNNDYHLTWYSPCINAGDNSAVMDPGDFEDDPRIAVVIVDMGADEYWYHLYHTNKIVPGGTIELRIVGWPTAAVTVALSDSLLNTPVSTQHGDLYLTWPPLESGYVGVIPGNGVLTVSFPVPSEWSLGDRYYLQALVGPWGGPWTRLTNADTLLVE